MSDDPSAIELRAVIENPDPNWIANDETYPFEASLPSGISIVGTKGPNRTLDFTVHRTSFPSCHFVRQLPPDCPSKLEIRVKWGAQISLWINERPQKTAAFHLGVRLPSELAFPSGADDASRTLDAAISFDLTAEELFLGFATKPKRLESRPSLVIPHATCEAFAMELYLKALHLMDHAAAARGHDLATLFAALAASTQQRIRERFAELTEYSDPVGDAEDIRVENDFDLTLASCASAFNDWRYLHEFNKDRFQYLGAGRLTKAIRLVCQERHPAAFAGVGV